jgi:hypothetical protein
MGKAKSKCLLLRLLQMVLAPTRPSELAAFAILGRAYVRVFQRHRCREFAPQGVLVGFVYGRFQLGPVSGCELQHPGVAGTG